MQAGAIGRALKRRLKTGFGVRAHAAGMDRIEALVAEIEAKAPHTESLYEDFRRLQAVVERAFGPSESLPDGALHRTMVDLPVNAVEALVQLGIRRAVNARLTAGWYRDRLVFLACLEKSASTLHEIVIRDLLEHSAGVVPQFGIQRGLEFGPTELASGAAMHGLIPMYAPDGGIVRGPYEPLPGNTRYVRELGARLVLLTRHPADRIVARACMTPDQESAARFRAQLESGTAFTDYFTMAAQTSLRADLEWMLNWILAMGAEDRFHVARYEDMALDSESHFQALHRFLTGKAIDDELRSQIAGRMSRTTSGGDLQPGAVEGRTYPRGYSGKVGVWRDYFSVRDVEQYNEIVQTLSTQNQRFGELKRIYPDILLDAGSVRDPSNHP